MSMISGVLFTCFHIAQSLETDIKLFICFIYREYYMPACGYEFYLRVFNSISRSLRSPVRCRVEHEKIKFISTSGHVIFCLLHKHTNDDVFDDFPKISDQFPKISDDFPKFFRR